MGGWWDSMDEAVERLTRLEPGSEFAGYRIEGMLDRGGMGVVYKAADVELDRTVALKIIAPEHTQNPDAVARFKSEAKLAASIEHANIVPIHRGGEFEGVLYLAMRLLPGTNLRQIIDEGPLPMDRIRRIITQVADALEAAHERGLVHRDVKPANIMVSGEGKHEHIYLTDFGLTKRLGTAGSLTRTGGWVGTPDYVAPEQIQAGRVDRRADVYSLGCVLYEMLTGSVAFPRDNEVAKLWAHVTDPPPPPSLKRPDLVKAFDQVVARATAKDPDARYQRASDLAAAVDGAAASAAGFRHAGSPSSSAGAQAGRGQVPMAGGGGRRAGRGHRGGSGLGFRLFRRFLEQGEAGGQAGVGTAGGGAHQQGRRRREGGHPNQGPRGHGNASREWATQQRAACDAPSRGRCGPVPAGIGCEAAQRAFLHQHPRRGAVLRQAPHLADHEGADRAGEHPGLPALSGGGEHQLQPQDRAPFVGAPVPP